jgi:hypothetical protein
MDLTGITALAVLRGDTQAWWANELTRRPDELEECEEPATANVEGLLCFLEGPVQRWYDNRIARREARRPRPTTPVIGPTAASAAMSVVRSRCSTKCSISGYSDTVIGWLSIVIGRTELLPPHCAGPACDGGPAYGGLRSQPSWTQEATIATPP